MSSAIRTFAMPPTKKNMRATYNPWQLYANNDVSMNLSDIKVLQNIATNESPTDIISPTFLSYSIDPCGQLFGYTSCGLLKYTTHRSIL